MSSRSNTGRVRRATVALVVLCGACGSSHEESRDSAIETGFSTPDLKADTGVTCAVPERMPTFASDVKPFVDARCNVCHSNQPRDGGFAPLGQNFESFANFQPWAEASLDSMRGKSMPPPESDALASVAEICMLKAWIEQGAKDD
jgi:uncharacterized membrane protein